MTKHIGKETRVINLFASDLDGTLLNAMHEADRTIRGAIKEALALGAHVVPATGRTVLPIGERGFTGLKIDGVCANGSIIRGHRGDVLKTFTFDQSTSEILAHEVCKINCRVPDAALERELKAFLAEHIDTVVNAPFDPVMFEITDKDCNKGASVAWLANYYGFTEDEVAVYGDGGNDLEMLRRFRHSYATANASAEAKAAAGTVIGHCAFHAVPKHILRTLRRERNRTTIA